MSRVSQLDLEFGAETINLMNHDNDHERLITVITVLLKRKFWLNETLLRWKISRTRELPDNIYHLSVIILQHMIMHDGGLPYKQVQMILEE